MTAVNILGAARLQKIPAYLFAELDCLKAKYQCQATDTNELIDLGEGNPCFMPSRNIITAFIKSLGKLDNHRYPSYAGALRARQAVARWYQNRFNVKLDPDTEVAMLIGSKEGIGHLFWAMIDKGDVVYVPSPSFPMYWNQTLLAGGIPKILPLVRANKFLPDLTMIKPAKRLKLLCLNYPNNPTAAVAPISFYEEVVNRAMKYGFYCFNDNVYSELYYDAPPHSILEIPGAKESCVEFHSLSKTFSMCGWRIGFVVGNRAMIKALLSIKQNIDSGPFGAIQEAAVYALNNAERIAAKTRATYKARLKLLSAGLRKIGWPAEMPKATFYLWTSIPYAKYRKDSVKFACSLLQQTGVLVTPGRGFGQAGEGYVRFAVVATNKKINQALTRIAQF